MAIDVTGVTIDELSERTSIDGNFMFLGCHGTTTQYTTWKVALDTLSGAIAGSFSDDKIRGIVTDEIGSQLGAGYFEKNASTAQNVTAPVAFAGTVDLKNTTKLYNGSSAADYMVSLPRNTYVNPSGDGALAEKSESSRVASQGDITTKIDELKTQFLGQHTQLLAIDGYSGSNVVTPTYTNKKYQYGQPAVTPVTSFYRYAGIRDQLPTDPEQIAAWASASHPEQRCVIKCIHSGWPGLKLTQSYRNYKSLTVVYLADTTPTTNVGNGLGIHSITVSCFEIDLARQYKEYKSTYHDGNNKSYFENKDDR